MESGVEIKAGYRYIFDSIQTKDHHISGGLTMLTCLEVFEKTIKWSWEDGSILLTKKDWHMDLVEEIPPKLEIRFLEEPNLKEKFFFHHSQNKKVKLTKDAHGFILIVDGEKTKLVSETTFKKDFGDELYDSVPMGYFMETELEQVFNDESVSNMMKFWVNKTNEIKDIGELDHKSDDDLGKVETPKETTFGWEKVKVVNNEQSDYLSFEFKSKNQYFLKDPKSPLNRRKKPFLMLVQVDEQKNPIVSPEGYCFFKELDRI